VPKRYQWIVLLAANYVFYYFAGIQYVGLLIYITTITYLSARYYEKIRMNKSISGVIAIFLILLPLLYFKYTGFLVENLNIILNAFNSSRKLSTMEIMLPLGISFYSFSALGYFIDVVQRKYEPFKNPFHLAVGISFFPCLVSGPIERQNKLVPQLLEEKKFDYELATYGLKQIAWGLFEKMVIADNLAVYVDKVFNDIHSYTGATLLAGSLFFTLQIYCDFAGYSDIAIGVAKLFGIQLTKNFASPYLSSSVQEFWGRWHISLSSWFRDYVYIPLGGNRKGKLKKNINVLITMLVSGLWHGAAWTFIAWGGIHGIVQVFENVLGINHKKNTNTFIRILRTIVVFSICSTLWIFFRAETFSDAWYLISHMLLGITNIKDYILELVLIGIGKAAIAKLGLVLTILFAYDYCSLKKDVINIISSKPLVVRWIIYCVFILFVAQFAYKGDAVQFVYAGF